MKSLNFKHFLLPLVVLCATTFLITSCEEESVTDIGDDISERYVFDGLKPLNDDALPEQKIQDATYFERNEGAFKDVLVKQPKFMTFNIPISSKIIELELDKWDIYTKDFAMEEESGQILPFETTGIFYNGKVKGEPNSRAAVSIFEDQLSVTVVSSEETYVVKQENELMAFYKASIASKDPHLTCTHNDSYSRGVKLEIEPEKIITERAICNTIRVRYVIDYSFRRYWGSHSAARDYLEARFNDVKSMYAAVGIPVDISRISWLSYRGRLQINSNTNNAIGDMFTEFQRRFGGSSSGAWDLNAAVVAVDANGRWLDPIIGGGYGVFAECNGTAPICKKGANLHPSITDGCRPIQLIGLHDSSPGNPHDVYFTHGLAHEIGHNFGIDQEYNGVSQDVMDHLAPSNLGIYPLYISSTVGDRMVNESNCYCTL